jgi:CRP-like cAMP-binding protein
MELGKGKGFGELALLTFEGKKPEKRSATVMSKDEVHCAILEKDDFNKVFLISM